MKKFLTVREAAGYLGISEDELEVMVEKDKIPTYKIGGVYTRLSLDDLNIYRRKIPRRPSGQESGRHFIADDIKDFFYFNDFYILSCIVIIIILYFIFK